MSAVKELIAPRPAPAVVDRPLTAAKVVGLLVLVLWALLAILLLTMVV